MSHPKPFHRNFRAIVEGPNSGYSGWGYIVDREYARSPEQYVRAFLLIQKDLTQLFEYIEPADTNLPTYSYRIHELLIRTCIEVEANFKAILAENIYTPLDKHGNVRAEKSWKIHDFRKVDVTHRLSSYSIHVPGWHGSASCLMPFAEWRTQPELSWYQAYNRSKHDRHQSFEIANFRNLLLAVSGLVVLLSAQFKTEDFSPRSTALTLGGHTYYSTEPAIGELFHISFPEDWPEEEKYEFDWSKLKLEPDRFSKIDYNKIQG
jgi:hypothetical protein